LDGFIRETDLAIEAQAKKIVAAVLGEVNEKPGTSIHIQRVRLGNRSRDACQGKKMYRP